MVRTIDKNKVPQFKDILYVFNFRYLCRRPDAYRKQDEHYFPCCSKCQVKIQKSNFLVKRFLYIIKMSEKSDDIRIRDIKDVDSGFLKKAQRHSASD